MSPETPNTSPPQPASGTSAPAGAGPAVPEPPARLVREWTACALVRAATRFLPVPVLDDAVAGRATRLAVQRTLRHHDRPYPATAVEPLYVDRSRRVGGWVVRRVLLFPVRKWTRLAGAVTGVPTDVGRVLLLGRATHRRLALGELVGPDEAALAAEAARLRAAFDTVEGEMDLRLLRGALSDSLRQVGDLTQAVARFAADRFGRNSDDPDDGTTDPARDVEDPDDAVAQSTRKVEEALRRPDVLRLLEEFDRRMDARLDPA